MGRTVGQLHVEDHLPVQVLGPVVRRGDLPHGDGPPEVAVFLRPDPILPVVQETYKEALKRPGAAPRTDSRRDRPPATAHRGGPGRPRSDDPRSCREGKAPSATFNRGALRLSEGLSGEGSSGDPLAPAGSLSPSVVMSGTPTGRNRNAEEADGNCWPRPWRRATPRRAPRNLLESPRDPGRRGAPAPPGGRGGCPSPRPLSRGNSGTRAAPPRSGGAGTSWAHRRRSRLPAQVGEHQRPYGGAERPRCVADRATCNIVATTEGIRRSY